uniref:Uncharacterized protein n=1 Tax=Rhizophora mucronata TaxID=61149 RepID=A0A2P2N4A0_RHIMU
MGSFKVEVSLVHEVLGSKAYPEFFLKRSFGRGLLQY